MDLALVGVNIVTSEEIICDVCLGIESGYIVSISSESLKARKTLKFKGCLVIPGIIDLHCDAIEKEIEPRPDVRFPYDIALLELDKRFASCGITTVFHAISFAEGELGLRSVSEAKKLINLIERVKDRTLCRNFVHLRFEISNIEAVDDIIDLINEKRVSLLSFMDHTPGRGQFKNEESYISYLQRTYNLNKEKALEIIEKKKEKAELSREIMEKIAEVCNQKGIPLASHDDNSPEKVDYMKRLGVKISEFPVNLPTAIHAAQNGLYVCLGAPNLIRGASHSGNLRAIDALKADVCHILVSDYLPWTLYHAPFLLARMRVMSLPSAIRLVTLNPAKALNLDSLGSIEINKIADLVVVELQEDIPQVLATFRGGIPIFVRRIDLV